MMYKQLLLMSFFSLASLSADTEMLIVTEEKASSAPICADKCAPPCPLYPESYLPNLNGECTGGYIYGDFLYWYAIEDNLSPCMTVRGVPNAVIVPGAPESVLAAVKTNHLDTKWDPGFRIGFGYLLPHDGWEIEANYTWYFNKKRHVFSVSSFGNTDFPNFPVNGQQGLLDPWINPDVLITMSEIFIYPEFDQVKTQWELQFNQIDFVFGKKLSLSRFMDMRAYAGARGAWFTTRFNNIASNKALFSVLFSSNNFSDRFRDRIWGAGLLVGVQPRWWFFQNFMLFSNIDAALLWGKIKVRKNEDYTSINLFGAKSIDFHNTSLNSFFKMQTVLDLSLGLHWEKTWCNRFITYFDLAWEQHVWFDVSHRNKLNSFSTNTGTSATTVTSLTSGFQNYDELQGNLMIGGAMFRFRVDF